MFHSLYCSRLFKRRSLGLIALLFTAGYANAQTTARDVADINEQTEVKEKSRPTLDVKGNKIFSRTELLEIVNPLLSKWAKDGQPYQPAQLDYGIHQMDQFIKSHGYLQGKVTRERVEETDEGSRVLLKVVEGPLYRVGKTTIEGAQLFTADEVREAVGLKAGDIANGEALGEGLYRRLKERYAKFGYIRYTADVTPTFHAKEDNSEGVVDFAITIDEDQQFRINSIKIIGVDKDSLNFLQREMLVRDGDIFDIELFHESIMRLNRTGLVDVIDGEKDVDWTDLQEKRMPQHVTSSNELPDVGPPLIDLVIHVNKAESGSVSKK
jgi:outer membrane protein assembly factor BamA